MKKLQNQLNFWAKQPRHFIHSPPIPEKVSEATAIAQNLPVGQLAFLAITVHHIMDLVCISPFKDAALSTG
jgi:hypothetical protein